LVIVSLIYTLLLAWNDQHAGTLVRAELAAGT